MIENTAETPPPPTDRRRPDGSLRRVIVASSIGNLLEWFDFAVYGYVAATVGALFFPQSDPTASLLLSFAVFGAAFAMRPLGGLVFGPLGDRIGRKSVLSFIVVLMSTATLLIGLLPTYSSIGLAAPVLLVVLRLVQGFSAGGELTGATTFVAEHAVPEHRGLQASWIQVSATMGFLLGLVAPTFLTSVMSQESFDQWGWRIAFLVAGPLGVIGFYMRRRLDETPEFEELEDEREEAPPALVPSLARSWRSIVLVGSLGVAVHLGYFIVLVYMPTYLKTVLGFEAADAFRAVAIGLLVDIAVIPFSGALSDRWGRRPILLATSAAFVVLTVPMFSLIGRSEGSAILALCVLGALHGIYLGTISATFVEVFATHVRFGGFSIGHNVSAAIFGGGAPFAATLLISLTGSNLSPAFIVAGGALISFVACTRISETARVPLGSIR